MRALFLALTAATVVAATTPAFALNPQPLPPRHMPPMARMHSVEPCHRYALHSRAHRACELRRHH